MKFMNIRVLVEYKYLFKEFDSFFKPVYTIL